MEELLALPEVKDASANSLKTLLYNSKEINSKVDPCAISYEVTLIGRKAQFESIYHLYEPHEVIIILYFYSGWPLATVNDSACNRRFN
ncbi:hypothetical protein QYM36_008294 [Artemia franciscana]|uniref:Uncharacterized protein n=1 Tax=Artemia franciscana TaxID=6661 RepID=A0AA88LHY6_ARTSF|nr:hypothetical protein QYM36_008294 [Artemia franciscana]